MEQNVLYEFHENFIFRTPVLSLYKNQLNVSDFFELSKELFFKEAIYLASPVLHDELVKWHNGQLSDEKEVEKLVISLFKYFTRMQSRCTPYGLFAACLTGSWGETSKIELEDVSKRHTRLDMNYLCALTQQLNSNASLQTYLKFYPNNSIYEFGGNLRYVEYKYVDNRRIHQISSVDHSDYLHIILKKSKNGASIEELSEVLVKSGISETESKAFIKELINSQILVSELEPAVTGDEFIFQILCVLEKINLDNNVPEIESIIKLLNETQTQIKKIDKNLGNDIDLYRTVFKQLKVLETPIEENHLFQTDLFKSASSAQLNNNIQSQLSSVIEFLNKLSNKIENPLFIKFRENFYKQYEDAEISLLEAMDTETGVGYLGKDVLGVNHLLDDIFIPSKEQQSENIIWDRQQQLLADKLLQALNNKNYCVVFTDEDAKLVEQRTDNLPASMSLMFRIVDSDNKIYLQNCGGSSAANLLGRFAHGDKKIYDIINDITAHEQKLYEDKILAEVVHLPESRTGNILLRPILRDYEIPYLGKSAMPINNQISLDDLMVSVKSNKIILRSKRLNKEIIPRLSTAHNYSINALPVYQFLCDLQTQEYEKSGLGFSWGVLSNNYKFLPRAEYQNVVVHRAKWQFQKTDFNILLEEKNTNYNEDVLEWRKQWNIPRFVVLVDGDNELLIDFESRLSLKMLVSSIRKRGIVIFEEFLFNHNDLLVKDNAGNGYTNEFIAILLKKKLDNTLLVPFLNGESNSILNRDFNIGSEWLYFKFYCGIKIGDKLLSDTIRPLTEILIKKKLIDKYFFIRYSDPDMHIRLRFHICEFKDLGYIIKIVNEYIQKYVSSGLIVKVQTDTYKRELERYGVNSMELSESIFYIDSIVTLNMLNLIEGDEGEQIKWQFAVRSVDELLDSFKLNLQEKFTFLELLRNGFVNEHGASKELKLQLDNKFRNLRKLVEEILNRNLDATRDSLPLIELLKWKNEQLVGVIGEIISLKTNNILQVDQNELMASHIHMMINRIFKSRQRTYEMVVYDLLYRFYKSVIGRAKSNKTENIIA